jgi:hypothetical protein
MVAIWLSFGRLPIGLGEVSASARRRSAAVRRVFEAENLD